MGRIVVSENLSLDGVIEDPAGDERFERGGWVGAIAARPGLAKATLDEALGAEAFLLGGRTYAWLAARWPTRTGALADRLNGLPKYVISTTADAAAWQNSTIVRGGAVEEAARLRRELAGDIVVAGSGQLVATLLEHDLVDELRLKVYSVVLGAGRRLFGETPAARPLRLAASTTLDDHVAFLTYRREREA
jgi:dihydrofolate reductase